MFLLFLTTSSFATLHTNRVLAFARFVVEPTVLSLVLWHATCVSGCTRASSITRLPGYANVVSLRFFERLGHEADACIGPSSLNTFIIRTCWSAFTDVDEAFVDTNLHFGVFRVREAGDLTITFDIPHEVGVGDNSATRALLSLLVFVIDDKKSTVLVLDHFEVRVDAHASLQFFTRRGIVDVIRTVLNMFQHVRLYPVPVPTASV